MLPRGIVSCWPSSRRSVTLSAVSAAIKPVRTRPSLVTDQIADVVRRNLVARIKDVHEQLFGPSRGDARQVWPNFLADALHGMTGLAILFENAGAAGRIATTVGDIGVACKRLQHDRPESTAARMGWTRRRNDSSCSWPRTSLVLAGAPAAERMSVSSATTRASTPADERRASRKHGLARRSRVAGPAVKQVLPCARRVCLRGGPHGRGLHGLRLRWPSQFAYQSSTSADSPLAAMTIALVRSSTV